MFIHYRTQGFVLKKEAYLESDQLFLLYTKDFGKLEILGKGIRKITSKLRSEIELFYLSEIEFIQGKTFKTLTDANLIEKFKEIRKNLKKLAFAFQIAEVLDCLVPLQEPEEKIWNNIYHTFKRLNIAKKEQEIKLIFYFFLWNLFADVGFKPELYLCVSCRKKIKAEKVYFSVREGGIICFLCQKKIKEKEEISWETVRILQLILEKKLQTLLNSKIGIKYLEQLKKISTKYFKFLKEQ